MNQARVEMLHDLLFNKYTTDYVNMMAKKFDTEKPEIELIDPEFLEGLAKVLMFGKEKYGRNNWRAGFKFSRLISAAYRHLGKINGGEDLDEESNLPHVYHLAACVMFLAWHMENKPELDDRWKP